MTNLFDIPKPYSCFRRKGLTEDSVHGQSSKQAESFSKKWRGLGWVAWIKEKENGNINQSILKRFLTW